MIRQDIAVKGIVRVNKFIPKEIDRVFLSAQYFHKFSFSNSITRFGENILLSREK